MEEKVNIESWKLDFIPTLFKPNVKLYIKLPSENFVREYITTSAGVPIPLKDDGSGGSFDPSDYDLEDFTNTSLFPFIRQGDNISSLTNDSGYITVADIPPFNPSDYDLTDFTNLDTDPFARISDIIGGSGIQSVVAGDRVSVNNTDPLNPVVSADDQISGLATVATTGDYNDLINTPVILADSLQAVTDVGNTTTNPIETGNITATDVNGGEPTFFGKFDSSDTSGNEGLPLLVFQDTDINKFVTVKTPALGFSDNIELEIPSVSGIIALESDIPTSSDFIEDTITNGQLLKAPTGNAVYDALQLKFNTPTGNSTQYLDGAGLPTTFPSLLSADKMVTVGRNATGSTLHKGTVVYINGSTGNRPNFVKAQANVESTSAGTFGVVYADISNNTDGNVITIGTIDTLDTRTVATNPFTTDTLVDGDTVYLDPNNAGYITNIKPSAPNHLVYIGKVTRTSPTSGTIVYRIQNGYELDELHDVAISSLTDKNIISWEAATNLWKNKTVVDVVGYTPANKAGETFTGTISATNLSGINTGDETVTTLGATINGASSATPNDTDLVPTVESSVVKKITWTNVKAFLKTYFDTIYLLSSDSSFGNFINGLIGKTTPTDVDGFVITDNADTAKAKKVTFTNAWLNYFKIKADAIYLKITSNGSDINNIATFRQNIGVDKLTSNGNSNYSILSTDKAVVTSATFTSPRTWTLPLSNSVNAGYEIIVADLFGGVSATNTLIISRSGSDTINGATSQTIAAQYGMRRFISDGISKWTFDAGVMRVSDYIGTTLTASVIVGTDSNSKLQPLSTATYPSLTELSYVKGLTSPAQTQIDTINVNVITITTAVSITTDTTSSGYVQHGRHVKISNGANAINIQCVSTSNADFVASYEKIGTATITFTAGAGITLTQLSGTAALSGVAGSKACLSRNSGIYYLQITNY